MALFIPFVLFLSLSQSPALATTKKPYIVYLGPHNHGREATVADFDLAADSHYGLLGSFLGGLENAREAMIHSCTKHINAFAANLDENEAAEIAKHPQVISVFRSKPKRLHTTHSWDFLGLGRNGKIPHESLWTKGRFGEDVIIANLDTGVWPESESFNDEGMGPVPSRWNGGCQNNTKEGVQCNRKLIGSKFYSKGPLSEHPQLVRGDPSYFTPRDLEGHGTHTLSTAAGRRVPGVSVGRQARGAASGGSPGARVASYKVCWNPIKHNNCWDVDILEAFDAAIHDGVDVISVSLGGDPVPLFEDSIAIGSFHAVREGVVVVASAGNDGPLQGSVSNLAPWMVTVGASSTDRDYSSSVITGSGRIMKGRSKSEDTLPENKIYPLIKSEDAALPGASNAKVCLPGSLDPKKVEGKIVVCSNGYFSELLIGEVVREAGGAGMILADPTDHPTMEADGLVEAVPYTLPATHIRHADALALYDYIGNTSHPIGTITPAITYYGAKPNPRLARFSARGPNTLIPEILKPDITAPGVDIVAAVSQQNGSSGAAYAFMEGTSMACPHVSGVAGLLKSLHPDWSPAMIKSAIMTTARVRDNSGETIKEDYSSLPMNPFGYGAGNIRPNGAMNPGLVYDLKTEDYLDFLCTLGYNNWKTTQMKVFSRNINYSCPENLVREEDLNYPSISLPGIFGYEKVTRTLKNVGKPATYTVRVDEPEGYNVTVRPRQLRFETVGEEKKFEVTVQATERIVSTEYMFGSLVWSDGEHHVRSPIVAKTLN